MHPKIFGFLRFSVFLDRFAVLFWIGLDLNTPLIYAFLVGFDINMYSILI